MTYQQDDNKGRIIFNAFCQQEKWCKVNKFAKRDYDKWDVSFQSGTTSNIGEIKKRKYDSTTYGEWYLQSDKYDALVELQKIVKEKKNKTTRIVYINHFDNNITLIWVLDSIDMEKLEKKMVQLQKNDYDDEKEWKLCYCLPHVLAYKHETDLTKSIFN